MNLATNLIRSARGHPHEPALRLAGQSVTYAEFLTRAQAAAGFIRASGVASGDRVGLMAPNVLAYPILFYAALLAGGIVVPLNPTLTTREVRYFLEDSGARLMFVTEPGTTAAVEAARDLDTEVVVVGADGLDDA